MTHYCYWKCIDHVCKGRIKIDRRKNDAISVVHCHTCVPDPVRVEAKRVVSRVVNISLTTDRTPSSLVSELLSDVSTDVARLLPSPSSLKHRIQRARNQKHKFGSLNKPKYNASQELFNSLSSVKQLDGCYTPVSTNENLLAPLEFSSSTNSDAPLFKFHLPSSSDLVPHAVKMESEMQFQNNPSDNVPANFVSFDINKPGEHDLESEMNILNQAVLLTQTENHLLESIKEQRQLVENARLSLNQAELKLNQLCNEWRQVCQDKINCCSQMMSGQSFIREAISSQSSSISHNDE